MDDDGKPDLVFKNASSGLIVVWIMNGVTIRTQEWISPNHVGPEWSIASIGDINGDSRLDIILQNSSHGWTVAWPLRGTSLIGQLWLGPQVADPKWRTAGPR
jgi:FG-GAP-like repeat